MSGVAALAWTQASTDSIESEGVRFGTGTSINTVTERMRITQSGIVGIGTPTPTALLTVAGDISSAGVVQVSGSSLTCSGAIKGAMRYSNTSNTLEYCNSTAWVSAGPSGTAPVAFSAIRTSNQTLSVNGWQDVTSWTEELDTNNNFSGSTFTVSAPGTYLVNANLRVSKASTAISCVGILKNSTFQKYSCATGSDEGSVVSAVMTAAAGDTFKVQAYSNNTSNYVYGDSAGSSGFSGVLVAPQSGGGGGGGATPAGSTSDVQYNSAGALAADTGNFTYASGLLTAPTISGTAHNGYYASYTTASVGSLGVGTINASGLITTTVGLNTAGTVSASTVSATNISGSIIQIGNTGATCSSAIKGAMRYSNTSNTLEYCNSTAWTSVGPSTSVPGFFMTKTGSTQSVANNTDTLVTLDNVSFDSNSNISSNRFTVTVPGTYVFSGSVRYSANAAGDNVYAIIHKNGAAIAAVQIKAQAAGSVSVPVSTVDRANVGDYYELHALQLSGSSMTVMNTGGGYTFFAGVMAAGGGGSGSGGATPAGSTGDIQFNSAGALAADTGQLSWDATNNRLGIGTGTPTVALHVVGDIAYTGVMSDVSDRRMKRDISTLGDSAAEKLMLLKPVTFRMKDADDMEYGFIAQDVQKVFPELVREGEILSLNYVGLIAPAVKTIQLLKRENDEQGDRIEALAEQNRLLRMQLKELTLEVGKTRREVERLTGTLH